jgi:Protein of unknown function (DUF1217)
MKITPFLASALFASSSSSSGGSSLVSTLVNARSGAGQAAQRDPIVTLRDAEKNGTKYVIAKSREPLVKRELDAFEKRVNSAKTVDEFLNDPVAAKVLLTANGLGDFADYKGLVSKTLKSDTTDPKSLAVRMGSQRSAWFETAKAYDFHNKGLTVLKEAFNVASIKDAYAEVLWRQSLDASAPGVSNALTFKDRAASLDSAYKILGDPVGREVITTAFGLPPQIAYQPLLSQATLIERTVDISKLKSPEYVDKLVKRYLVALNGGSSITA